MVAGYACPKGLHKDCTRPVLSTLAENPGLMAQVAGQVVLSVNGDLP